jgi:DNA-binding LytR/AlgR family response regulator
VDVLFLDVDMPGLTGLELLRALPQPPAVVLTTAHAAHALTAYELGVVDYLLKPIQFERFVRIIGRLRPAPPLLLGPAAEPMGEAAPPEGLFLKTEVGSERVRFAELLLQGYGNFVKVHEVAAHLLLTPTTLKKLEERLPTPTFLRVHKSYLVNLVHIERVSGNYLQVGPRAIPVGNTYRQEVLRRLRIS